MRPLLGPALAILTFCLMAFAVTPSLGEALFGFERQETFLKERLESGETCQYQLLRLWSKDNALYAEAKLLLDGKSIPCQLIFPDAEPTGGLSVFGILSEGDTISGSGRFMFPEKPRNPGQFDSYAYYLSQHRFFSVYLNRVYLDKPHSWYDARAWLGSVRRGLGSVIDSSLDPESAAILKAMLLGDKGSLSTDQKELFSRAGISHIVAISGMHLTILMAALEELIKKRFRPGMKSLLLQGLLWSYTALTGFSIATLRAAIMLTYRQLAPLLDADPDDISGLSLAALVILLIRPWAAVSSAFWLTFLAVIGLWSGRLFALKLIFLPYAIREKISAGLGVTIFTAPAVCWFFYEASIGSFFLNLLIVPMAQAVLLLGASGMLLSILSPAAGFGMTRLCGVLIHLLIRFSAVSGDLPWLSFHGKPELWQLLFYYGALVLIITGWGYQRASRHRSVNVLGALLLMVIVFLPFEDNRVTFLDVGQGDCCIMEWDGKVMVVDAGPSYETVIAPFLKYRGIQSIDLLVLSHPDADHMDGAVLLLEDGMEVKALLEADAPSHETPERAYLEKLVKNQGGTVERAGGDDSFYLENSSIYLDILSPVRLFGNTNDDSLTMCVRVSDLFQIVFTGDISGEVDPDLDLGGIDASLPVFLKVAHHGSRYSTSEAFLAELSPDLSLISCGKNNRYGHPHEALLERFHALDLPYQITAQNGAVWIRSIWSGLSDDGLGSSADFSIRRLLLGSFPARTLEYRHMFE
ncbi:MAG: DNA internalization-related competence protein ComEC/Rec2 [Firmicutes bacterium]|nr:DNA internalization-related competence protein ComEC/Rec2 [Bacillota bacterium]